MKNVCKTVYTGDRIGNANSCVSYFTIAIFQDSLHENNGTISMLPNLVRGSNGFYVCI